MNSPFSFLSDDQVITDPIQVQNHSKDWTNQFPIQSSGVLFPRSNNEVSKIIKTAIELNLKIVPSGGRTGLSGGAVATQNEWILSLDKMNKIFKVSPIDSSVHLQAGVITKNLQEEVNKSDLFFPIEFAATGSSQIGGNVATNAGGVNVVKYGPTRDWVNGLTVVTGTGEILNLNNGLIKNNTGYDLRHLFIGSEGTLGVITELEIKLTTPPYEKKVLLLGVKSLNNILDCFLFSKKRLPLLSFEIFTDLALKKVLNAQPSLSHPLESSCPYYLLIETEVSQSFKEENLIETLEFYFEKDWAVDGVISSNSTQFKNLWKYRELISESIAPFSPYKNDISVRISKIPEFINTIHTTVLKSHTDLEVVIFGHIGDGNLHINTLKPQNMTQDDFIKRCEKVNELLFIELEKIGGSISAEHGVGLLKKPYLKYSKSKEEIILMKRIKEVFDPHKVLNPGKIF